MTKPVVSEKKKEEKNGHLIIITPKDEQHIMVVYNNEPHEQSSWMLRFYSVSDVDARIKFYKENHPEYPYPSIGDIPDWLWVLWDKSKFNRYPDFLFVFCFGDMNEDFREKIKRLKKP
jgi:hypothetical protein